MAIIKAELDKDTNLYLDLSERITFIAGDSGTGKTFMINALDDISKNPDLALIDGIVPEQLLILKNSDDIHKLDNIDKKIVFIDRYDIYSADAKKKIWNAMSKNQGIYVLMSRYPDLPCNYGFSKKSFKELEDKTIEKNGKIKRIIKVK